MEANCLFLCYPACSTCKKARQWLMENQISYEERNIKEAKPSAAELKAWQAKAGVPLRKLFNTSGILYKSLALKDKLPGMSEEEQLALLASDGMLVKRPLLITGNRVLVGFKEAEWKTMG